MKKSLKNVALIALTGVMALSSAFSSFAAYRGSRNGDYPGFATFTQEYASSTLSGNTVTNSWSGFAMTLPGTPVLETSQDGTDWYYKVEGAGMISSSYFPITKYGAGDIATFVNGMLTTTKQEKGLFVGGALTQATPVTLGSYQFYQLARSEATPNGNYNDYCYVRELPGLGYVQVLLVDNCDMGDTLNNLLGGVA